MPLLRRPCPPRRNERGKSRFFRRLTVRSARGAAQRVVPTLSIYEGLISKILKD
jgi:hypothetical protein